MIRGLRLLELQTDIPPAVRVHWLLGALNMASTPAAKKHVKEAMKRVQQQARQPKYPLFYSIEPLVKWAFQKTETFDLSRFIVQLRLTTLMRSCDLANITWALFFDDDQGFFLRTVDKKGNPQLMGISGSVLSNTIAYMHQHMEFPHPRFLRSSVDPQLPLGSERIAKLALLAMEQCNIDTTVFKAHSIRGAAATALLKHGVPRELIKNRGGWKTTGTLDEYYSRLHHSQNWDQLIKDCANSVLSSSSSSGEHAADQASGSSAGAPTSKVPVGLSTKEESASGTEDWGGPALLPDLTARGLLRGINSHNQCPACSFDMHREAAYTCVICGRTYHVRCLATVPDPAHPPAGFRYLQKCFICHLRSTLPPRPPHPPPFRMGPEAVIDAMGVLD